MRRFVAVWLLASGFAGSGCSGSTPEVQSVQSLRTAPPVSEPALTTPPEILPLTSVAVSRVAISSVDSTVTGSTVLEKFKSEDELKIEYVISEFRRRYWDQIINRTFETSPLDELSEGDQIVANKRSFDERRKAPKYSKSGTIQRVIVIRTAIVSNNATAISCEQNDIQVWDGKGTADEADDVLLDGELIMNKQRYDLQKRGDLWKIVASQPAEVDCSSAF
jgi:hypothetical protein